MVQWTDIIEYRRHKCDNLNDDSFIIFPKGVVYIVYIRLVQVQILGARRVQGEENII